MQVETNDPRPPYVQVADGLRHAIQSGELAAGTKLPSGRELASEWGVALMTLQKAIDQLRVE
jgi:GntR family transcriptional regulator